VKDRLPALAKELGVGVIAFECNYLGPNVEQLDITVDMVKLYNPSDQTMKWVREAMKARPIGLDEIDRIDEK
jgi:predicted CoA-binding protein